MIVGAVSEHLQARVALFVSGPQGQQEVDFLLDTGFNEELMLPPGVITALNLSVVSRRFVRLADGSRVESPIYQAQVLWDGAARAVSILAGGSQPLLGMALCAKHNVNIDMVDGGRVAVTPLA